MRENGFLEQAVSIFDNAPLQPSIKELKCKGMPVIYSLLKTTSMIVPQDQGIIWLLKHLYRKFLLNDELFTCLKKIDIKK